MGKSVVFHNGNRVCALGQGTWQMGRSPARHDEEINALRRGVELGMTLIDTAEMYDNEELVGEAIRGLREEVFLVSKVHPSHAGYEGTKRACEQSLRKLGTERIDLYLLHWKGSYPFAETVRAMLELQREGKIALWGVSNMDVADMERFTALSGGETCAANQVLYNLGYRGIEYDLVPWSARYRMPLMAYSPVGEGRLLSHPVLSKIARRHHATPAQIALAWTIRNPGMVAIPKAGRVAHVEDNFRSLSIRLNEEDSAELNAAFPAPTRKIPLAGW